MVKLSCMAIRQPTAKAFSNFDQVSWTDLVQESHEGAIARAGPA